MARRKLGVRHRPARKQPLTIEEAEALDREALEGIGRMIGSGGIDNFFDEHVDWDALERARTEAPPG